MNCKCFFTIIAIFFTLQSCKKDLPTAPTIITGKVVDENNLPVMGVNFHCSGLQYKGLSGISTFNVYSQSDKNGNYTLSVVVPNGTDEVNFGAENNPFGINYGIFLNSNNTFLRITSPIRISNYGETNTYNFQFRKI